ncbi:hypothetical protein [Desulfatiferula olefinivorans]
MGVHHKIEGAVKGKAGNGSGKAHRGLTGQALAGDEKGSCTVPDGHKAAAQIHGHMGGGHHDGARAFIEGEVSGQRLAQHGDDQAVAPEALDLVRRLEPHHHILIGAGDFENVVEHLAAGVDPDRHGAAHGHAADPDEGDGAPGIEGIARIRGFDEAHHGVGQQKAHGAGIEAPVGHADRSVTHEDLETVTGKPLITPGAGEGKAAFDGDEIADGQAHVGPEHLDKGAGTRGGFRIAKHHADRHAAHGHGFVHGTRRAIDPKTQAAAHAETSGGHGHIPGRGARHAPGGDDKEAVHIDHPVALIGQSALGDGQGQHSTAVRGFLFKGQIAGKGEAGGIPDGHGDIGAGDLHIGPGRKGQVKGLPPVKGDGFMDGRSHGVDGKGEGSGDAKAGNRHGHGTLKRSGQTRAPDDQDALGVSDPHQIGGQRHGGVDGGDGNHPVPVLGFAVFHSEDTGKGLTGHGQMGQVIGIGRNLTALNPEIGGCRVDGQGEQASEGESGKACGKVDVGQGSGKVTAAHQKLSGCDIGADQLDAAVAQAQMDVADVDAHIFPDGFDGKTSGKNLSEDMEFHVVPAETVDPGGKGKGFRHSAHGETPVHGLGQIIVLHAQTPGKGQTGNTDHLGRARGLEGEGAGSEQHHQIGTVDRYAQGSGTVTRKQRDIRGGDQDAGVAVDRGFFNGDAAGKRSQGGDQSHEVRTEPADPGCDAKGHRRPTGRDGAVNVLTQAVVLDRQIAGNGQTTHTHNRCGALGTQGHSPVGPDQKGQVRAGHPDAQTAVVGAGKKGDAGAGGHNTLIRRIIFKGEGTGQGGDGGRKDQGVTREAAERPLARAKNKITKMPVHREGFGDILASGGVDAQGKGTGKGQKVAWRQKGDVAPGVGGVGAVIENHHGQGGA